MIRQSLRLKIRSLYLEGYLAREIKAALGIDGCIYQAALRPSWETKERKQNYYKRRLIRKLCKEA